MPAGSDGGKADGGVRLMSGFEVPSHYIDFHKYYLSSRRIDTLMQLGTLDPAAQAIVTESEGIFPEYPANGRLDAFELYRVEQLQPDTDPVALQHLWKLLEVADRYPMKAPGLRDTAVTERITQPKLKGPNAIAIASLPTALQTTAKLVERYKDYDSDPTTIQGIDIDLAQSAGHLPGLEADLTLIRREWWIRATATGEAALLGPMPGAGTSVGTLGGMSFQTTYDIKLHEQRTSGPNEWTGKLELLTNIEVKVATASGDTVVLVALDDTRESVLPGPTASLPTGAGGAYVVERFHAGERVDAFHLLVPTIGQARATDLSRYLDDTLYGDGVPLAKNVTSTADANGVYHVDFDYATTAIPATAAQRTAVDAVATPTIPAGWYRVFVPMTDGSDHEQLITVFPSGVLRTPVDGFRFAMHDGRKSLVAPAGTATLELVPETRELFYAEPTNHRGGSVVVEPWMRSSYPY